MNIRVSIPFFFASYYFTLVAGKERRSRSRRAAERKNHPLYQIRNILFFGLLGSLIGIAILAATQALIFLIFAAN